MTDLDVVGLEDAAAEHVVDTAGGSNDDMDSGSEDPGVLPHRGSSDAGVALHLEVVSEGAHDLLNLLGELAGWGEDESLALVDGKVEVVEDSRAKGGCLSST